jgi:N-acylneuraminate cytidylyltransferase
MDSKLNILAIIPARGGSKGIPGKNLKVIAGTSLLGWSIKAARESRFGLRIVVSTDSAAIAEEAHRWDAEVILRPDNISGDKASSEAALMHVLESLENAEEYKPDLVCFLQCTSPLTTGEDIDGTIEKLLKENADTALAVAPFHYFLWQPETNGNWGGINHDKAVRQLRQDREPQYVETGSVYVMKAKEFQETGHRFFGKTVAHVTPAERRWEVDDPVDLEIAEVLLRQQPKPTLPFKPEAIIFDFDGVFTDNKVYVDQDGRETVRCDRGDGMGIEMLKKAGIPMLILSKEKNPVVEARARKLEIECVQGVEDKISELVKWAELTGVHLTQCLYMGNDVNDLNCMNRVGISVAPRDAHHSVRTSTSLILDSSGGCGALRELAEKVLLTPNNV